MVAPIFDRNRDVIQLRLGGVPVNFLTAGQLGELTKSLGRHFNFSKSKNRKFSVEMDPRCVHAVDIEALAFMGPAPPVFSTGLSGRQTCYVAGAIAFTAMPEGNRRTSDT